MKNFFIKILTVVLGFIFILSGVPAVKAQDSGNYEFTLEEITVTAQKREENQQKVAIAMDVLSGDDLSEMGKTDLSDMLANITGVIVARSSDGMRITLRGISDDDEDQMGQSMSMPTVAVNTDGVRSNRKDNGFALFDIERVEVLYGPQGTLYSSNSPGGIVNIVTGAPHLEKFEGNALVELGNYNLKKVEGMVNTPISDKWALRTAVSYIKRDGYTSSGEDDEDSQAGRLRALYQPTDTFSIIVTGQFNKKGGLGRGNGVEGFVYQDDVDDPWGRARTQSGGYSKGQDETTKSFYLNMDWDTGFGTITLVPQYATTVEDSESPVVEGPPNELGVRWQKRNNREAGIEARIASNSDFAVKWILGYNYYKSKDYNNFGIYDNPAFEFRTNREEASSIFGNITYPVTDSTRLTGGVRYSHDNVTGDGASYKMAAPIEGIDERPYEYNEEDYDMRYSAPDWSFGVEHDLGENSMIYANWSTSYRVRAFGSVDNEPVPEELKAYKAGAKNRFFDNKLQINFEAFYYDYKNYPASEGVTVWYDLNEDGVMDRDETETDPGSDQYGNGRHIGFDLQTSIIVTSRSMLNISWSYLNSEWTDLYFDYYYPFTNTLDAEGNVIEKTIEDVSYNGKSMTNSPPHTISVNYFYNFLLPNGASLKPGINARYQTSYRLAWKDEYYPGDSQEAYRMIDLSAVYGSPSGKYSLSCYVKNLENYAVKRGYKAPTSNETWTLNLGEPRTYGAIFQIKF